MAAQDPKPAASAPRPPVWSRPRTGGRGPQPSLTVGMIVDAAVRLADAEGVDAVSMRRIASELGVGTMSLYRYVETKDDLLDLMCDQVMGEDADGGSGSGSGDDGSVGDGEVGADWRADLSGIALRYRALMLRHPWMLPISASRPPLGPNVLRRTERLLGVLDGLGLGIDEISGLTGTVIAYVHGVVLTETARAEAIRGTGQTDEDYRRLVGPYLMEVLAAGEHPLLARFVAEATDDPDPEQVFRWGLQRVLDGVETEIARLRPA